MSIEKLKDIHITNDDIGWVASLLGVTLSLMILERL